MKLSTKQLKQIIKEEINNLKTEADSNKQKWAQHTQKTHWSKTRFSERTVKTKMKEIVDQTYTMGVILKAIGTKVHPRTNEKLWDRIKVFKPQLRIMRQAAEEMSRAYVDIGFGLQKSIDRKRKNLKTYATAGKDPKLGFFEDLIIVYSRIATAFLTLDNIRKTTKPEVFSMNNFDEKKLEQIDNIIEAVKKFKEAFTALVTGCPQSIKNQFIKRDAAEFADSFNAEWLIELQNILK
jgi:hypothetical protein